MKFVLVAATVAALCVACGTKRNEERCLEGLCSDPDLPFCDVDGTIAGEPNACIAVDCTPGEVASCRDDRALTCNAGGTNYDLVDCPYGCDANGCKPCTTPECEKTIIPRYVPSACDEIAPGDPRVISANASIDTTSDLNCSDIVTQPSGVDICIVRYSALTIEQNQTLRITGREPSQLSSITISTLPESSTWVVVQERTALVAVRSDLAPVRERLEGAVAQGIGPQAARVVVLASVRMEVPLSQCQRLWSSCAAELAPIPATASPALPAVRQHSSRAVVGSESRVRSMQTEAVEGETACRSQQSRLVVVGRVERSCCRV
jgi:hypothetical protein